MTEINFVDSTVRDGNQSLWALMMTAGMILPIAPIMDRARFKVIDLTGPAIGFVHVARHLKEDPWERLRLCYKAMPKTPLNSWFRSRGITQFGSDTPISVAKLWIKRLIANGIRRITFLEEENDFSNIPRLVRLAKSEGAKTVACLVYSISPVHTDEYYAQKTKEAVKTGVDVIEVKDPAGLLTPERTRTLVPTIQQNAKGLPDELEFHSHCTAGSAITSQCYLEGIKLGIKTVRTAVSPLANGSSMPSTENILENARLLGYSSNIDIDAVKTIADHFRYIGKRQGFPIGMPTEYNLYQREHQIPGGVMATLRWQLAQIGSEHLLEKVVEETARVRKELGYPIMVTPASQFIVAQATVNVKLKERYKVVLEEVMKKAMGYSGRSPGPVDQNLMDRIMSLPQGKELSNWNPPQPSIKELRKEIGPGLSDDELLLRLCVSEEAIKEMRAAGPIKTDYPRGDKPIIALIQELANQKKVNYVHVQKADFSLRLFKRKVEAI